MSDTLEFAGLYPIEIDIYKKHKKSVLAASIGDVNGRGILATLLNNGTMLDTTGVTLRLAFNNSEGVTKMYEFEKVKIEGAYKYKIHYPSELLENQGSKVVLAEIKGFFDGRVISYLPIYIYVYDSLDPLYLPSEEQIDFLVSALGKIDDVEQKYEQAELNRDALYAIAEASRDALVDSINTKLAENTKGVFKESLINHKKPRPMITWIDDDGQRGFYNKLRPLALEYGIKFTSSIITSRPHGFPGERPWEEGYIKYQEMLEMRSEGTGEFVSHSHDNLNYAEITEEQLHSDIKKSQDILSRYGFNDRVLVYPFGGENASVHDVARQYYDCGIDVFNAGGPIGSYVKQPMNQYSINRMNVQVTDNLQGIYDVLDEAATNNKWVVIMSHVDEGGWYDELHVRNVIERALLNGMEFVTVLEGLQEHGNIAQYGNTIINNEGVVYGGLNVEKLDAYEPNAPITDFPLGSMTILPMRYADSEVLNLPIGNVGGNLEVYRAHQGDGYSYQRFITTGYKRIFYRYWNMATSEWTPFIDIINSSSGVNLVGVGRFEPNAPITEYPETTITTMPIRYTDGVAFNILGLGDGVSGILETHYFTGSSAFGYQKFIATILNRVFYRYWDFSSESWTVFKEPAMHGSKIVTGTVTYTAETVGSTQFLKYKGGNLPSEPRSLVIVPMGLDHSVTFSLVSYSAVNFGVRASKSGVEFSYMVLL